MKVCNVCLVEHPVDNFYKGSNRCKPCAIAYSMAWQKANPDKAKKAWKKQNKKRWVEQKQDQEYMTKKAIYRQQNSARRVANAKAWNEANRERYNLHVANSHIKRRIAKDAKKFKILDKEYKRLYASCCTFCGSKDKITMDHIIPLSRSGNHSIGNLQPLCRKCNSSKKTRFISEYKYYLSKLQDTNR